MKRMTEQIQGKVIVLTGASSGIGEAAAKELAGKGAKVVLVARREERLQALKKAIEADGGEVSYKVTDVASREEMLELGKFAVDQYGQIDVMINNAGLMPLSTLGEMKIDEWDKMVDINIKGVLYGIAAVLPHMRERSQGHIINVSSVAGHVVSPSSAVYSGTKYAVRAISEGFRKEEVAAESNVRSTIISPGMVATELADSISDEEKRNKLKEGYRSGKAIQPEDIARAIRYAIEQPESVSVNEIIVRPSNQAN